MGEISKGKHFERALEIKLKVNLDELRRFIATRTKELKFQDCKYVVYEEKDSATQDFAKFLVITVWKESSGGITDDLIGVFTLQLFKGPYTVFHVPPSHAWDFKNKEAKLKDRETLPGWLGASAFNHFVDEAPFIGFLKLLFDELQRSGFIDVRSYIAGTEIDRDRVIELIEIAIAVDIPYLKRLHRDNDEFPLWIAKMQDVLKAAFGQNSDEYRDFVLAVMSRKLIGGEEDFQREYVKNLTKYEIALKKVMQRDKLVGIGRKPATTPRSSRYELTSPVYWLERFWCCRPVATVVDWIKTAVTWVRSPKRLILFIIGLVGFIAAIITIVRYFS